MKDVIIEEALSVLKKGGLIIYPTETCYGVGVDATNQAAVLKLLHYKRRPEGKAISIAVYDQKMAEQYVELNAEALRIYREFLPGPVTVISKSKHQVARGLEAEDGTLGIRIPDYGLALELIQKLGRPITATSANSAGKKTPYTVQDIYDNINDVQRVMIDYVMDFGELPHNPPSTVINTTKQELQIIRKGRVSLGSMSYTQVVNSEAEMIQEGEKLVAKYKNLLEDNCLLIMFNADLGAGKTHFVKGVAQALGIEDIIKSPTYSLIREYNYNLFGKDAVLAHFDAWRLEDLKELEHLGLEDYMVKGNIIAVEWAGSTQEYFERVAQRKDLYTVEVQIDYLSKDSRQVSIYEAR
jgi:L-threonylcarbamoyladenylate synthase